jgi:hypothetical protein
MVERSTLLVRLKEKDGVAQGSYWQVYGKYIQTFTNNKFLLVDLASLSIEQLSQVRKQLDDDLEHLTSSFTQLRAAQAKFRECLKSIVSGVTPRVEGE